MVFAGYPAGPPLGQIPGPRYFPALYHFQDDQKLGGCTVNSMGGFCRGVALGSPVDDPPRSYGVPLFSFCGSLHGRMEPYSRIGKESHPFLLLALSSQVITGLVRFLTWGSSREVLAGVFVVQLLSSIPFLVLAALAVSSGAEETDVKR